jgi:hypothetical protein
MRLIVAALVAHAHRPKAEGHQEATQMDNHENGTKEGSTGGRRDFR